MVGDVSAREVWTVRTIPEVGTSAQEDKPWKKCTTGSVLPSTAQHRACLWCKHQADREVTLRLQRASLHTCSREVACLSG